MDYSESTAPSASEDVPSPIHLIRRGSPRNWAGQDGQPTDSTASGASSASTCSPAPTNQDTAYATSLERFFVPIPNYEAVDHPADTASPTNAQPELPSHGPGRRWHILRQENIK
ncbi:hypothetical protein PCASD_01133 [Puccinia coronata f. sp. avenae]|uniref:Uncharacterized protein n=1 Tax=Puccinia coronata f. sp. avenae TaxID=200324 RepID=A0A2N5VLH4_9BASI|nr:hypothetical protein PCASD_01133 [Puccinia coronata f. sp. avenae]